LKGDELKMEWTPIIDSAHHCTIFVGDENGTVDINIQLLDFAGNDLKVKNVVYLYMSAGADGNVLSTAAGIDTTSEGDGDVLELLIDNYWMAISEDDGDIDVTIDGTTSTDYFLNVVLPNGKVVTSEKITFTS